MTRLSGAVLLTLAAISAGCARRAHVDIPCTADAECGPGSACTGLICVPRFGDDSAWGVELLPKPEVAYAPTEVVAFRFGPESVDLVVEPKVSLPLQLSSDVLGGALHVSVTVTARIAGRPDRSFDAESSSTLADSLRAKDSKFVLALPQTTVGRVATVHVMPGPPVDADLPPIALPATLVEDVRISLPLATSLPSIAGVLHSAVDAPVPGWTVRARRAERLLSSRGLTDATGAFRLAVFPDAPGLPQPEVTIQLSPPTDSPGQPVLTTPLLTLTMPNTTVAPVRLPSFTKPDWFKFHVVGQGAAGAVPVVGATVRLRTDLKDAVGAAAVFQADGQTDPDGGLVLPLLPGTASQARSYELTVIPPPNSDFATRCTPAYTVVTGGASLAEAKSAMETMLAEKPSVTGQVTRAGGIPAAGVAITATRTAGPLQVACVGDNGSPSTTAITDTQGHYALRLDPGTYRFDYDPTAEAPMPRGTEEDVIVAHEMPHDFELPDGALVEAIVQTPDGTPLPSTEMLVWQVDCRGTSPCDPAKAKASLSGRATSDASGRVRLMLPRP